MIISAVECFKVCPNWNVSSDDHDENRTIIVKVTTQNPEFVGWGEASTGEGSGSHILTLFAEQVLPFAIGLDARNIQFVVGKIYFEGCRRSGTAIMPCLSAFDIALWDIFAKSCGQPLWRLLGGFGRPVTTYLNVDAEGTVANESIQQLTAPVFSNSIRGIKIGIGNILQSASQQFVKTESFWTVEQDLKRVAALRACIGAEVNLMVCANYELSPRLAMLYASSLRNLDIRWFEDPVDILNAETCIVLAKEGHAVAGFSRMCETQMFGNMLIRGAIQVVQIDLGLVGGFSQALHIASLAAYRNLSVTVKGATTLIGAAAESQFLFARPNCNYFELFEASIGEVSKFSSLENGYIAPNDRPGLGIEPNSMLLSTA